METQSLETSSVKRLSRRQFIGLAAGTTGGALVSLLVACQPAAPAQPTTAPAPAAAPTAAPPAAKPTTPSVIVQPTAPAPAPAQPAVPTPQPTKAPAAQFKTDHLTVAFTPDPVSWDPWPVNGMPGFSIMQHVFDTPLFRDWKMQLVPSLVEKWEWTSPSTLKLTTRKGVKYHNGDEFTADDIRFTLLEIKKPETKSIWNAMVQGIVDIEVPDKNTAIIKTKGPDRVLLRNLTLEQTMSEKIRTSIGAQKATKGIGTGPYRLVEYVPHQQVILEAFDGYWGPKPKAKRITFKIIVEDGTRIAALQSSSVSMINNVPPDKMAAVDKGETKIIAVPTARIIYMAMRVDRPPLDNVKVRQALNYAINKEEIVQSFFQGKTQVASAPLPPMVFGSSTELKPWPYDPKKAREMLKQEGVEGFTLNMGISTGRYLMDRQTGEAIAGYLQEVGVNVKADVQEWGTYLAEVFKNEKSKYDMHMLAWGTINMEPDYALRYHWHGIDGAKNTAYNNPEVNRLLDEARTQINDEAKAKQLYFQAQKLIWDDCLWLWLHLTPLISGVNKKLQGYTPTADEYERLWDAYLE